MNHFKHYENKSGNSGITRFKSERDAIEITFNTGEIYRYDNQKPGAKHVAEMKRLAEEGHGLATYISQNVRENFAAHQRPRSLSKI